MRCMLGLNTDTMIYLLRYLYLDDTYKYLALVAQYEGLEIWRMKIIMPTVWQSVLFPPGIHQVCHLPSIWPELTTWRTGIKNLNNKKCEREEKETKIQTNIQTKTRESSRTIKDHGPKAARKPADASNCPIQPINQQHNLDCFRV